MSNNLSDKFQKYLNRCEICFSSYDRSQKTPVIICSRHHTICRSCLDILNRHATCPFCRQVIQFSKVVINYYVFDLLPLPRIAPSQIICEEDLEVTNNVNFNQGQNTGRNPQNEQNFLRVKNNVRVQAKNSQRPSSSLTRQYHQTANESINARPLSYLYPEEEHFEQETEEQRHKKIWHRLGAIFITIIQLPFTFFNFFLAVTYPISQCMDSSHQMSFIILRPWLFGMGCLEMVLAGCMLAANWLHKRGVLSKTKTLEFGLYLIELTEFKVILWGIVEIGLFVEDIMEHCSKLVFYYGALMILFHVSLFLIYLLCGKQKVINYFDN